VTDIILIKELKRTWEEYADIGGKNEISGANFFVAFQKILELNEIN
jgi:hypothetical protein